MLFFTIIKVSLKSLLVNKLRSFLAMLGIIIGVAAVISMLALGAGAQKQVLDRMTAMGTNLLIVRPGQRGTGGVISGTQQTLTMDDAEAIVNLLPNTERVAPVSNNSAQVKYFGKNTRTSVVGTVPGYFPMRNFEVEKGRGFSNNESDGRARVAVLGPLTVENLFGTDDPLGQTVKINGINFSVIGVMKAKGDQGYFNPDDQIIIPLSTAMKEVFGQTANKANSVKEIDIEGVDNADVTKLQDEVTALLRKRHKLQPAAPDDVTIRNQAEMLETASAFTKTFTILLGGIASISLFVGGIGIMNIMLVTVTERTREIGVRKAIGAKGRDILGQFLIEAITMSGLGGCIGAGLGIGSAEAVRHFSQYATIVEPSAVVVAIAFSAAVGVFFGYYPAFRAAKLDPIEALRYE